MAYGRTRRRIRRRNIVSFRTSKGRKRKKTGGASLSSHTSYSGMTGGRAARWERSKSDASKLYRTYSRGNRKTGRVPGWEGNAPKRKYTKRRKTGGTKVARKRRKIGRPRKVGRPRRRISTRGTAALRRLYLQNLKSRGRHRNVRRRRRRNSWFGERAAHARASRFGWRRRRRAYVRRGGRRRLYYNSMGRRYKRAYRRVIKGRRRKTFDVWRNRRRNFGMDTVKQLLLGAAGFIGAALLISKIPQNIKDKIKIAGMDLAPAVIPLVAGVGLMYLAPKVKFLSKYSGVVNAIAFGLALSGGVFLVKEGIKKASPELAGKLGVAGWIETPFSTRGYVPGTRGYVPRLGEYLPRGLGAVNQMPSIPGIDRSLAIPGNRAMSEVPYGTGLPKTVRDYNRFAWSGVYDASTYE